MSRRPQYMLLAFLALSDAVFGRVGGGQSYSGGGYSSSSSSSGGSSDGDGIGILIELLIRLVIYYPSIGIPLVIVIAVVWYSRSRQTAGDAAFKNLQQWSSSNNVARAPAPPDLEKFREHDPNFSVPLFLDFLTGLYCKAQLSAGKAVTAYLSPSAQQGFSYADVTSVIVGSIRVLRAQATSTRDLVSVEIEANLSFQDGREFYVVDSLTLVRKRGAKTPPPEVVYALGCPSCGSPEAADEDGTCKSCGQKVNDGQFGWIVSERERRHTTTKSPVVLSSSGQELGTDLPTVRNPALQAKLALLVQKDPEFDEGKFQQFARETFCALQDAWTTLKWEQARPLETDFLFQQHQYWIDAYRRDGLRNVLEEVQVERVETARVELDRFFESITVRIFARMKDYTVRQADGQVVSGFPNQSRRFSEYWTFVRRAGVTSKERDATRCPNCGAPLDRVSHVGDCEYCNARITRGDFDWILSRIEQDEAYR